jgi:hypothetical protein
MEGYDLYDSKKEYSPWQTDMYFSKDSLQPSDCFEILKMSTGFKYYGWMYHGIDPIQGVYCSLEMALYFNPQTVSENWEYNEVIDKLSADADSKKWTPEGGFSKTPAGDDVLSNISFTSYYVGGLQYAGKIGTNETVWAKYRRRRLESIKYCFRAEQFSDWGDWSDWTLEQPLITGDLLDVESQTMYRRRKKADVRL